VSMFQVYVKRNPS